MDLAYLSQLLECPVCCQTPREPPIFQCENGHLLCKDCRPRMLQCPQGACHLSDQRSRLAEDLLHQSDLPRPCKYSTFGCFHEDQIADLPEHESTCGYRKVQCPELECGDRMMERELMAHLESEHGVVVVAADPTTGEDKGDIKKRKRGEEEQLWDQCLWVVDSDDMRSHCYDGTWPLSVWKAKDYTFCSMLLKQRNSTLWYAWIYDLSSPNITHKSFTAVISARNRTGTRTVTYTGRVHPVDSGVQQVVDTSDCLVMPDGFVENLLQSYPTEQREDTEGEELKFLLAIQYEVKMVKSDTEEKKRIKNCEAAL